ncbi:MAG: peptide chain release factor N(5)-glutamine methyltransferase [Rhodothermales bacterium]|nr:peptide chain release factor N(5)-glutamine methyltransferase [Rhodothermales bacterium]
MQGTEISRRLVVENALNRVRSAGVPAERREVEWMLQSVEGLSRAGFVAGLNEPPRADALPGFDRMISRRMAHEPVQYILGEADFFGRTFRVTPDVLIPRPETEWLVERVMGAALASGEAAAKAAARAAPRILDAGTGSGCIAITLALELPAAACTAFDISPGALEVARSNAERLGADIRFEVRDMLDEAPDAWLGSFDLLVSNPPYVPDSERGALERQVADFEPEEALFTGDDELTFYRGLARLGRAVLAPAGRLIVETHADHASGVLGVMESAGYRDGSVERDLAGRDRIVSVLRP